MNGRGAETPSPARIATFIALIVVGTALVIVAIRITTGSWASGALAGAISGGFTAGAASTFARRRSRS